MNLRTNVNKIHSDLTENFSNVQISEKSNIRLGNFIELIVLENNKDLKIQISKYELEKDIFSWSYFSNPEQEDSIVERVSHVNSFTNDVSDIFDKNRFDSDYLKKLN